MESAIKEIVARAVETHTFPGCVVGVVTRAGYRDIFSFGRFTYKHDAPAVREDSLFDVASITKSIPTGSLALRALEQGRITLSDPVVSLLPELQTRYRDEITVKHLLTHTLDSNLQLSRYKDLPPEEILAAIYHADITSIPGTAFRYCNATSILLGILVERVFDEPLDTLAQSHFFNPLNMTATTFYPPDEIKSAIVPSEIDEWRGGTVQGEIHDESAWKLGEIMVPGSAGLFSNVPDLLTFLEMLLGSGKYRGIRFFKPETLTQLSTNQIPETGACTGLGWELNQSQYMGSQCSNRTIGKTGFTGCVVMCDLIKGVGLVLLSNYTWPHRKNQKEQINRVRREIADVIFRQSSKLGYG